MLYKHTAVIKSKTSICFLSSLELKIEDASLKIQISLNEEKWFHALLGAKKRVCNLKYILSWDFRIKIYGENAIKFEMLQNDFSTSLSGIYNEIAFIFLVHEFQTTTHEIVLNI
jgi:hypothetical protein